MITTTKKQFAEFKRHVDRFVALFGLHGLYDVTTRHKTTKAADVWAQCDANGDTRQVTISLSTQADSAHPAPPMETLAAHEVAHLLIADLVVLAKWRYATEAEIDAVNERVSNVLERVLTAQ